MKLFAAVTKGLEDISAIELAEVGATNIEVLQKYIFFEVEDVNICSTLRTIDDIFVRIKRTGYYDTFINDLEKALPEAIDQLKSFRGEIKKASVTISVYKNQKVDKKDIEELIKAQVEKNLGLLVSRDDEADINIRIIIEENNLIVGIRLFQRPLKDRNYAIRENYMGSLRPTIAASIIKMVVGNRKDLEMVDNFCGSGTFLAESTFFGQKPHGGDINESGVKVSTNTLKTFFNINKPEVFVQDATSTHWKDNQFDIATSNYPWDSQVEVESFSDLYELSIREYARILKPESALGFILTKPDLMTKFIKKYFPNHKIQQRQIGYLGQTPWIIVASNFPN